MKIISRNEAKESGLKRFFTGDLCKNNHIAERNILSGCCLPCDTIKSKNYRELNSEKSKKSSKESRLKHKETRRQDNKRWREKNVERLKRSKKEYVKNNKTKVAAGKARYYQNNKEKCLATSKKHHEENREHYSSLTKKWRENNRDQVRLNNRKRKQKIKNAEGSHTVKDIFRILKSQRNKCAACFKKLVKKEYHVDHIYPLIRGGSNWPSNLQILCPPCNMSKGSKLPEDFYAGRGFLL